MTAHCPLLLLVFLFTNANSSLAVSFVRFVYILNVPILVFNIRSEYFLQTGNTCACCFFASLFSFATLFRGLFTSLVVCEGTYMYMHVYLYKCMLVFSASVLNYFRVTPYPKFLHTPYSNYVCRRLSIVGTHLFRCYTYIHV